MTNKLLHRIARRLSEWITKPETADDTDTIATTEVDIDERLVRYGTLAQQRGFDQLYLLLSFDCDTDEDVAAAEILQPELERRGIRATFAVPGIQLERGAKTYRRLADNGAEFMNHGALPHAEWRDTRYYSITFYSDMETAEVIADIDEGHRIVERVTGRPPAGFRAPHFGSFQSPEQLALVYDKAKGLGYDYCSTTIPQFALDHGPCFDVGGLWEVPLFGSFRHPPTLLDSWTYLSSYEQYALKDEYYDLFEETVRRLKEARIPGLLSFYVDPAHVVEQQPFMRALDLIHESKILSLQFRDVVAMAERAGAAAR